MKLLHLSDLHYSREKKSKYIDLFDKLAVDILSNFGQIDLFFITGDLVDKFGNGNFIDTINEIYYLIFELSIKLNIETSHIVIIQGNHEINSNKFTLVPQQKIKNTIYKDISTSSELLDDQEKTEKGDGTLNDNFKQIEDFYSFSKENLDFEKCIFKNPFYSCFCYCFGNQKIGVLGLNNVWYSELHNNNSEAHNNNYGQIIMGIHQINEGIERLKDCDLMIGLSHFSLSYHHEIERTIIENKVIESFDLYLTGHSHYNSNNIVQKSNGTTITSCLINSARAFNYNNYLSDSKKYSLGYDVIEVKSYDVDINHRVYSDKTSNFVNDTLIAHDGISKYRLQTEEVDSFINMRDILNEQKLEFDKLLISYSIKTEAPKCVDELFISPVLSLEDVNKEVKVKSIDYKDLIESTKNIIIFGSRESGKSTLLHRIFSNYLNSSLETNKYPLYMDCKNIKTDNFKELLKSNYKCVEKFIASKEVVILIDNLDVRNIEFIESLRLYIQSINCSKVIISSDLLISGEIPIDFYDTSLVNYMLVKIRPLTAEKVKNLTKKWFIESNNLDNEIINKIVLFSKDNYVPTYPIFVSMLLWLSEQKENMLSFSNALLIENFVEKLLEKHSSQQYIYNDFDFNNKKKLLTEIAEFIHANNEKDIPYNEFYSLICNHISARKFPFKVDKIAEDLISSGILIYKNNNIGFRYYCIYSYFISLKLGYDRSYLDEILAGNGLFFYLDEIDILTALNRDRIDVIEKIGVRLANMLQDVKDSIGADLGDIDDFFKREFMLAPLVSEKMMSPEAKAIKEEAERVNVDNLLLASEEENIKKLKDRFEPIGKLAEFERMWVLTARVLRNLDDYKDNAEKLLIMDKILDSAIYFIYLFNYMFFKKYILDIDKKLEKDLLNFMTLQFILSPLCNRDLISNEYW